MGPSIIKGLKDAEALEGIPFELTCEAAATPKPEVTWYVDLLTFVKKITYNFKYLN